jgi:hypothetical protein
MVNDPSYVFNPQLGGVNWGYCKPRSNKLKEVKYKIDIVTSNLPESGTNSVIFLQFFGERGMSQEKEIGNNLVAGTTKSYNLEFEDLGEIKKVLIKIEGTNDYRCKEIKVSSDGKKPIIFQCLKKLLPCNENTSPFFCQEELLPEGESAYDITLKTNSEPESDTKSPILIALIGENGVSNYRMFSETGAEKNSQIQNTIKIHDVGRITGYLIKLAEHGKWKGSYMLVKTIQTNLVKQFDLKDVVLENPGKDFYKFDLNKKTNTNTGMDKENRHKGTNSFSTGGFSDLLNSADNLFSEHDDDDEEDDDGLTELVQDNLLDVTEKGGSEAALDTGINSDINSNDPNGGYLNKKEKKEIVELSCEQKMVNTEASIDTFGANYPTANFDYTNILARCPSNCHLVQGQVYGLGIHPDISPICLSALTDRAISEYGGIVSISIFPGLEKYVIKEENSKSKKLLKVSSYFGKTKKSYTISKVDNVDLVERDFRILDSKGKISHEGRLEVRVNGKWGTICNQNNNEISAWRICRDLGYNSGKWLGKNEQVNFCKNFKGANYCGSENTISFFSNITCDKKNKNFMECHKKNANSDVCLHYLDALISCSSSKSEGENLIPNGTVRLARTKKEGHKITGRLEISKNGEFNPVCQNGFTNESAEVACKQMGFKKGEIEIDNKSAFTKEQGDDSPFSATEVNCTGKEKKISECNFKDFDINCTHDLDVVLKCVGEKGDPTGDLEIKSQNILESNPALGKLSMLKLKATCEMKGNSHKLRGDPGSVFLISCPKDCNQQKGNIHGIGIYSSDSNICQAAIHSGVLSNEKGGTFALTKIWGQKYYGGMTRNGLESTEFSDKMPFSFTISSVNSSWKNMWKSYKENKGGIFLEKSANISFLDKNKSLVVGRLSSKKKQKPNERSFFFLASEIQNEFKS